MWWNRTYHRWCRMKTLFSVLVILLLSLTVVYAASTAEVKYELDTKGTGVDVIVKNVPFDVDVSMSVASDNVNNKVYSMKVHTKGTAFAAGEPVFDSGARGQWLPNAGAPSQNKLLGGNVWQYMFTADHGTVDATKDSFKTLLQLRLRASSDGQITLDDVNANEVGGNIEAFAIGPITALAVAPQDSVCGDGVVNHDTGEQCDDRNVLGSAAAGNYNAGKDGCSADCQVEDIGYSCTNKGHGARLSVCTKLPAKQLLTGKLNALINGQCYPDCAHPAALYKRADGQAQIQYDGEGKLTSQQKFQLVNHVINAFQDFFAETVKVEE